MIIVILLIFILSSQIYNVVLPYYKNNLTDDIIHFHFFLLFSK